MSALVLCRTVCTPHLHKKEQLGVVGQRLLRRQVLHVLPGLTEGKRFAVVPAQARALSHPRRLHLADFFGFTRPAYLVQRCSFYRVRDL